MTLLPGSRALARWTLPALLAVGLPLTATASHAASADGVTVTIPGGVSMTIDDVAPQSGDNITVTFDYTVPAGGQSSSALDTYLDAESPAYGTDLANAVCVGGTNVATISCVPNSSQAESIDLAFGHALTGGESASWTISYTVIGAADSSFALLSVFPDGPSPLVNVTIAAPPRADAAVSLTAKPQFGLLTPAIVYSVRVTDNGPAALQSAVVTTTLPAGLTPTGNSACTSTSGQAVCTFPALTVGASATETFSVPLGLLAVGVAEKASATITTSTPADPVAANNSSSVTCTYLGGLLAGCG